MIEVLLADDSVDTHELVKLALGEQFRVTCVPSVSQVMPLLLQQHFALLLLDVSLPDGDGFQICAQVRNSDLTRNLPIFFLTGKTGVANLVTGFALGADDYIEKPFNPLELNARVQAKINQLRRSEAGESELLKGNLRLRPLQQTVSIVKENLEVPLSLKPIEFKLLIYFMQNEERVLSRQQLLNAVWGNATFIADLNFSETREARESGGQGPGWSAAISLSPPLSLVSKKTDSEYSARPCSPCRSPF